MKSRFLVPVVLGLSLSPIVRAQSTDSLRVSADHYRIYTSSGADAAWEDVVAAMTHVDVVLIGENHDDPVAHHIEAATLQAAIDQGWAVGASLEMFSRDVQGVVDEYLSGVITESHFRSSARPWGNYETDYRPFVEAAREAGMPVIAANAPRRYVNRVSRLGPKSLDALSDEALRWVAPIPYAQASPAYKAEWDALMREAMGDSAPAESDTSATRHGGPMDNVLSAQSLWDATMAWSIVEHLTRHPGSRVVHIAGSFHVKNGTGIAEHVERYRPGTRQLLIVAVPAEDISTFDPEEHAGLGDFVILGDEGLPRTMQVGQGTR